MVMQVSRHNGREGGVRSQQPVPGAAPSSAQRRQRLEALAEQLHQGRYTPDLDALARALLAKQPHLFGLSEEEARVLLAEEAGQGAEQKDRG